jgi:hypothetical protein
MVHPGTLFTGDSGAFLCIPMKTGVKFEHCGPPAGLLPGFSHPRRRRWAGSWRGSGAWISS